jgi:hypothetical protein
MLNRVQLAKLCVGYNKANLNKASGEFARLVRDVFTVSRGVDMSYKQSCMVAEKLAHQIPTAQKHSCTQDEFIEAVMGKQQIFASAEKRAILESTDQVLKLAKMHGSMHAHPLKALELQRHARWEAKRTTFIASLSRFGRFFKLPEVQQCRILSFVVVHRLVALRCTSKAMLKIADDERLWKSLALTYFPAVSMMTPASYRGFFVASMGAGSETALATFDDVEIVFTLKEKVWNDEDEDEWRVRFNVSVPFDGRHAVLVNEAISTEDCDCQCHKCELQACTQGTEVDGDGVPIDSDCSCSDDCKCWCTESLSLLIEQEMCVSVYLWNKKTKKYVAIMTDQPEDMENWRTVGAWPPCTVFTAKMPGNYAKYEHCTETFRDYFEPEFLVQITWASGTRRGDQLQQGSGEITFCAEE